MADSRFQSKNIYIEDDYQNIILVDPNKIVLPDGRVQERLVDHEDLVMYANLQAKVIPRSKLAVGTNFDDIVENTVIGTFEGETGIQVDFLRPRGKDAFDTSWSDQFTGKGAREGQALNQRVESSFTDSTGTRKFTRKSINQADTQSLGIESISLKLNQAYIPVVSIQMVDVGGRTLFEQGENSPYAAFFNLPYPMFFLTLKGYFGKAVKFELMLKSFNASFAPDSGNYIITTEYIGRTAAILSDISIQHLFTLPQMYNSILTVQNTSVGTTQQELAVASTNGIGTAQNSTVNTTKGLQKLNEVYSIYESKGLIEKGFPRISLPSLVMRLENLDRFINESFGKEDMSVLNDIDKWGELIEEYRQNVYSTVFANSFFQKYIDTGSVIIFGDKVFYSLKPEFGGRQSEETAITDLEKIISQYNEDLLGNQTFGDNGTYTIKGKKQQGEIPFNITSADIIKEVDVRELSDEDWTQTFIVRQRRVPVQIEDGTSPELDAFKLQIIAASSVENIVLNNTTQQTEILPKKYFMFGEPSPNGGIPKGSFLAKLEELQNKFNSQSQLIEEQLSKALAEKIKSSDTGLGFNPTIKNIMAVILASADGFLRLMDEVHRNAWEKRKDPSRLRAVIPPDKNFGTDGKDVVQKATNSQGELTDDNYVYPWPQYFEEEKNEKGDVFYTVKYPGDPSVINRTKAYLWDIWPEVEFVEEYLTGTVQKIAIPTPVDYNNQQQFTKFIGVNAIEFPNDQQPYLNLSEVSFLYEMYERALLATNYNKLYKDTSYAQEIYSALGEMEFFNIKEAVEESPQLQAILKRFKFNYSNFVNYLQNISLNGTGPSWNLLIRGEWVTDYIREDVDTSFAVYSVDTISEASVSVQGADESIKKIEAYLTGTSSNQLTLLDTAPFNSLTWLKRQMANGGSINKAEDANNTTNSLTFFSDKKTISNITQDDNYNKFTTHVTWRKNTGTNQFNGILNTDNFIQSNGQSYPTQTIYGSSTNAQLKQYYDNRGQKDYFPTEGRVNYANRYLEVSGNVTSIQTTSILNTPYFVNGINEGVKQFKTGNTDTPYVGLGYLVLNSLPLITTKEKLKKIDTTSGIVSDLDYLYATLTKFSAIHKLPKAWILKYGSIWHRYKTYTETGVDILDGIWTDFDAQEAYDPANSNPTTKYVIKNYTGGTAEITLTTTSSTPGPVVATNNLINLGFYPELINNFYYFFAQDDLLTGYTQSDWTEAYNDSLRIGKTNQSTVFLAPGFDTSSPNRTMLINNWYMYYDTSSDSNFVTNNFNGYLLFPSTGALNFNQTKFECVNSSGFMTKEILNNQQMFNGSVRGLWMSPHFGWFDNSIIQKPTPSQYFKVIYSGQSEQEAFSFQSTSVYSDIEEVLAVFSKPILDYFEQEFLNYCKPVGYQTIDNVGDTSGINTSVFFGDAKTTPDLYYSNLYTLMNNFFITPKVTLSNQENKDGGVLAKEQMNNVVKFLEGFLNYDVILKIGNPSNYNRKVFGSFTSDSRYQVVDKIDFGPYQKNVLPGDGSGITLAQSRALNPAAWDALEMWVGFSTIDGLTYTDSGSYYTDFFKDFNIEFSDTNVVRLYQIIKMYGTQKVNDDNLTAAQFYTQFNNFIVSQLNFQSRMMNQTFISLNKNLPNVTEQRVNNRISTIEGEVPKVETWETFKAFNDRWIAGGDFQTRTLFEEFLFLDRANRNIGDDVIVDVSFLLGYLKSQTASFSIYSLIGEILGKNNFIFMALPSYTNFYGIQDAVSTTGRSVDPEVANSVFGTFLSVDYQKSKPKFLCMYVGKPSEHLELKENKSVKYQSDTFDLRRGTFNPLIENQENKTDWAYSNKVVGFNLDFGIRNQNIFMSIGLNQNQFKNTSEVFQQLVNIGNQASGDKVAQQSTSLFNVYRTRSYTCEVTALGNVMIQPTMYFNLRHVPMFTGPYLITDVSHTINQNGFLTNFTGVRVPIYSFPRVDELVASVNKDLIQRYRQQFKSKQSTSTTAENATNTTSSGTTGSNNTTSLGTTNACLELTKYEDLDFVDRVVTQVTRSELKNYLQLAGMTGTNSKLGAYIYGIAGLTSSINNPGVVQGVNNNLFGITTQISWPGSLASFFAGQICTQTKQGTTTALATFDSFTDSVDFMISYLRPNVNLIEKLILVNPNVNVVISIANSLTQLYLTTWLDVSGRGKTAAQIKEIVDQSITDGKLTQAEYNKLRDVFQNAVTATL